MTELPMLTIARSDSRRLAELLALMVTVDSAKPTSAAGEDVKAKLLELSNAWHVRAFLSQNAILKEPPTNSRLLGAGSFLDPVNDVLSRRLEQMTRGVGGDFRTSLSLRMTDEFFAQVQWVNGREYSIDIGLKLIVQLFLGAITLSQPGAKSSSTLPDPYDPKYGHGAHLVYDSQAPLLQALNASAFKLLLPEEDWRRLLAFELFSKAIEFALLHEFGHATRGHLEFLAKRGAPRVRSESGDRPDSISPLTHQLLEAQADDTASLFMVAKWKHLSQQHSFSEGPLMLGRYGFCVTRPEHAQLIHAYAVALLFIVIDAEDRKAVLVGNMSNTEGNPRSPTYPTPAYRSWRFDRWQHSMGVAPAPWLSCIEHVRDDLQADRFPHATSIFDRQMNLKDLQNYDQSLIEHSRHDAEGRALMAHEGEYAKLFAPQRPMMPPRFWGEAKPSLLQTFKEFFGFRGNNR
ncbi:MAG: hypothetical protein KDG55_05225 [Rhodocyclaceae bacterium]|nr:hypothetical protein [Rhodocyclaceae bacterium]